MPWLEWLDRKQDPGLSGKAPYRLLKPVHKLDAGDHDAPNMLIEGDNLDALKAQFQFRPVPLLQDSQPLWKYVRHTMQAADAVCARRRRYRVDLGVLLNDGNGLR